MKIKTITVWTLMFVLLSSICFAAIRHVMPIPGEENVIVTWDSDDLSDSVVRYATDTDFSNALSKTEAALVTQHSVTLESFEKDTQYYLEVQSTTADGITSTNNNNGDYYGFLLPSPNTITIDTTPELVGSDKLTVSGTTKAGSSIDVAVNGMLQGTITADEQGRFSTDVILGEQDNNVELASTGPYGLLADTNFFVHSDVSNPEITVDGLTDDILEGNVQLNITVNKEATVKIFLNGQQVHASSDYITEFPYQYTLTLQEENNLRIESTDRAGNTGTFESVVEQISSLSIDLTFPDLANFGGPAGTITVRGSGNDIRGKTMPGATVMVWVFQDEDDLPAEGEIPESDPDETDTADDEGNFVVIVDLEDKTKETVSRTVVRDGIPYEERGARYSTLDNVRNYVILRVVDDYDRSEQLRLNYEVRPCGTGGDFTITLDNDDHNLKPYRLKDGNERLNFKIRLNWIGWDEYVGVNNVQVMYDGQDLTPDMFDKDEYKCITEGNIFPPSLQPIMRPQPNQDGTYWYTVYKLEPYEGLDDSLISSWGDLFKKSKNNKCTFPLRIVIDYTARTRDYVGIRDGGAAETQRERRNTQVECITITKAIDSVGDPNALIPDIIMDNSIELLNETLNLINEFMPSLEWVVSQTRKACITGLISMIGMKAWTRAKCNTPLSDADACANQIEREKWVYNKYRLACDRIWCNPVPVNPGKNKETKQCNIKVDREYPKGGKCRPGSQADPLFACVPTTDDANRLCGVGWKNVNSIQPTDCYTQSRYTGQPGDICCKKKEAVSSDGIMIQNIEYMNEEDWQNIYSDIKPYDLKLTSADLFVEEPWDYGAYMGYVTETMEVQEPRPELNPPLFKDEFIGPFAIGFGKAVASRSRIYISGTASKAAFDQGGTLENPLTWKYLRENNLISDNDLQRQKDLNPTFDEDDYVDDTRYYSQQMLNTENEVECDSRSGSWASSSAGQGKCTNRTTGAMINLYDDASIVTTTTTSELKDISVQYVSGIHGTQCFNQKNIIASGCFFNPKGGLASFPSLIQCGCVNDIYGRLDQFRNIAQSMLDCLTQVKHTGTADVGACKQMFAQHVCDLMTAVLVNTVLQKSDPQTWGDVGQSVGVGRVTDFNKVAGLGVTDGVALLQEEYGSNIGGEVDFSVNSLTHSVCMGALFNEWDPGFVAAFKGERGGPPHASDVLIQPAEREQIGFNPISGAATFEYRVGMSFTAGSRIRELRVYLVCDNEGDCRGSPQGEWLLFRTEGNELPGGIITNIEKNAFETLSGYMHVGDNEGPGWRYNKVIVEWISEEGAQYNGRQSMRIIDRTTRPFVDCKVVPSTVLATQSGTPQGTQSTLSTGNDIVYCSILSGDRFAYFREAPPTTDQIINIRPDETSKEIKVPFTIIGQYGQFGNPFTQPFWLVVQELTSDGTGTASNPQQIQPDVSLSDAYHGISFPIQSLFSDIRSNIQKTGREYPGFDDCSASYTNENLITKSSPLLFGFKPDEQLFRTRIRPGAGGPGPGSLIVQESNIEFEVKTLIEYQEIRVYLRDKNHAIARVNKAEYTVLMDHVFTSTAPHWKHTYTGTIRLPDNLKNGEDVYVDIESTLVGSSANSELDELKFTLNLDTYNSAELFDQDSFDDNINNIRINGDSLSFTFNGATITINNFDEKQKCAFEVTKADQTTQRIRKNIKIGIYDDLNGVPSNTAVFWQARKQEFIVPVILQKQFGATASAQSTTTTGSTS